MGKFGEREVSDNCSEDGILNFLDFVLDKIGRLIYKLILDFFFVRCLKIIYFFVDVLIGLFIFFCV